MLAAVPFAEFVMALCLFWCICFPIDAIGQEKEVSVASSMVECSQGIQRILFAKSKVGQLDNKKRLVSEPPRLCNHASSCTFAMVYPLDSADRVFTPRLTFSADMLAVDGGKGGAPMSGRLVAVYSGFKMTPHNGWFPNATKIGAFGATFATSRCETPKSDREFIREPGVDTDSIGDFSLPVDVSTRRKISSLKNRTVFRLLPYAVYTDSGGKQWMIYSRFLGEAVEIAVTRVKWDQSSLSVSRLGPVSSGVYYRGNAVSVADLQFEVLDFVEVPSQVPPTAWITVSNFSVPESRGVLENPK